MNFFDGLEKFNSNIAVITRARQYTYNQLLELADNVTQNIGSRNLVFLVASNRLMSLSFYVGFLRKGIVPIMISEDIEYSLFNNLLEKYKPNFVILPTDKSVLCQQKALEVIEDYAIIETEFNIKHQLNEQLALLLTTSGSTGSPKLVRQSYKNIVSNTNAIIEYLGIVSEDRAITTMPMNYTYGLSIINSHLIAGASIVINSAPLMSKDFWKAIKENSATTFGGVPYIYEMLKKLRFERMELPSIKYITQAGGKLSAELALEFVKIAKNKNFKFIVMYGQTEATARMSYLPWEYAESKVGSMGVAIPNGKFTLIDVDGSVIIKPDVAGELVYEGENVTLGYAECIEDLAKGDENNGRLETGDIAKRDNDGFYFIVGRKKRFLKMFGSRVNLDEVELILRQAGFDCAVNGVDDHMKIYTTQKETMEEIKKMIAEKTNINFSAFNVLYIEEIPRNENGKIAYVKLQ